MRASGSVQNSEAPELGQSYATALDEYLATGGEEALRSAYELGRSALADGRGLLDMVAIHQAVITP
jgi:hypothetical protein